MNTRPHSIPAAAPAPPTMDVSYFDDQVTIALSPALARDLAAIWAQAHAGDPLLNETRPRWHDDTIALISNAALAEQQAGTGPAAVDVPILAIVGNPQTSPAHGAGAPSEPPAPPAVSSADEGDDHGPASAGETRTEVTGR